MPNWCENTLYVSGKKKTVESFLDLVRGQETDHDEVLEFDFNRIVPYPEEYTLMDGAYRQWEVDNKDVPWGDRPPRPKDGYNAGGYEWCCSNWGTKWNASNVRVALTSRGCTIHFTTAWCPPSPVIVKASELFPDLSFKLKYWEGGQGFQGSFIASKGTIVEEWEGDYRGNRGG